MTREEAIRIFRGHMSFALDTETNVGEKMDLASEMSVDAFVALGMLKLDEPLSAEDEARDVIVTYFDTHGIDSAISGALNILNRLDAAGLKIVEK